MSGATANMVLRLAPGLMDRLEAAVLAERGRRGDRTVTKSTLIREALEAYLDTVETTETTGDG